MKTLLFLQETTPIPWIGYGGIISKIHQRQETYQSRMALEAAIRL